MPVIHGYTPEGFLSPARKRLMVERVTAAAVEAEGLPTTDRTYVLVHEVPDGGWGWQGDVIDRGMFDRLLPTDPPTAEHDDELNREGVTRGHVRPITSPTLAALNSSRR